MIARVKTWSVATRAAALFLLAIFFFSIMDSMAKELSRHLPTFQVIWARYIFQLLFSLAILAPHLRRLLVTRYPKLQITRSAFLFGGTLCFFLGLKYMKIADVTAIFEAAPLIITVMAAVVLGEHVGPRRWIAVGIGLIGALIIIQPGGDSFDWVNFLPLMAATFFAAYAISTRFLGNEENPTTSFLYTALVGSLIASLIVPFVWETPSGINWIMMIMLGAIGGIAHYLLVQAFTIGEASFLAPLGYVSLGFNATWGFLFFNEVPAPNVWLGAVLIISAGLFVWWKERHS